MAIEYIDKPIVLDETYREGNKALCNILSNITKSKVIVFDNVADMKADMDVAAGMVAKTLGYYAVNDGGGAYYTIKERRESDVEDNGSIHFVGERFVAEKLNDNLFLSNIDFKSVYYNSETNEGNRCKVYYAIIDKKLKPKLLLASNSIDKVQDCYKIHSRYNSTLSINAGLFNTSSGETVGTVYSNGIKLKNNTIYGNYNSGSEILYMTSDGTLNSIRSDSATEEQISSLNPVWAVQGWYPIVKEGTYLNNRSKTDFAPRSWIGQNSEGDYIIGCCDGRLYKYKGMCLQEVYQFCLNIGFTPYFLYNLDGGASTQMFYKNNRVNGLTSSGEVRKVANMISFGNHTSYNISANGESVGCNNDLSVKEINRNKVYSNVFQVISNDNGIGFEAIRKLSDTEYERAFKIEANKNDNNNNNNNFVRISGIKNNGIFARFMDINAIDESINLFGNTVLKSSWWKQLQALSMLPVIGSGESQNIRVVGLSSCIAGSTFNIDLPIYKLINANSVTLSNAKIKVWQNNSALTSDYVDLSSISSNGTFNISINYVGCAIHLETNVYKLPNYVNNTPCIINFTATANFS